MEFVILPLSNVMTNAEKNMLFTPANFQQTSHNDVMLTIQKLVKLQSKNVLDLPTLSIAKYLNEIELFTFANIYLVFCLSRSYTKIIYFLM